MNKDKAKSRLLSDVTDKILKKTNSKRKKNLIDSDLNLTRTNRTFISKEEIEDIKLPDLKLENVFDNKESTKSDSSNNLNNLDKTTKHDLFLQSNELQNPNNEQVNLSFKKENILKNEDSSKRVEKHKTNFINLKKQKNTINLTSEDNNVKFLNSKSDDSGFNIKHENKKVLKNKVEDNKKIKNSSNESNLKKITILIDEQAINKKVSELHKEATSYSLLKIKKNKKTELLNNNSKLISISNNVLNQDIPLKTSELITYSNNNYNFNKEPYPFSLNNIEVLSADRKSPNYKEFSNLKNLNEIEKEKLELIKKKYGLKKEIKTLIDQSNDFSFKNKFLTEKLFLDSNKKKEVLKTVLEESKVNPNYDSLRHQIGKLTIYLENLKTLLNDVEFDISINNLNIDEGSEIIQDLESKIYIAQFLLDKLRNKN